MTAERTSPEERATRLLGVGRLTEIAAEIRAAEAVAHREGRVQAIKELARPTTVIKDISLAFPANPISVLIDKARREGFVEGHGVGQLVMQKRAAKEVGFHRDGELPLGICTCEKCWPLKPAVDRICALEPETPESRP